MADIFRDRIPDDFMHTWLKARRHPTWELAYEAAVATLRDPKWHTCYAKHILNKANKTEHTKVAPHPVPTSSHPLSKQPAPQSATPALPKPIQTQTKLDFPVSKNSNVNPNFKPDLNENPTKLVCDRCGAIHKWLAHLCTSDRHQDKGKKVTPLTAEEFMARVKHRWQAGFWFNKHLDAFTSPTVEKTAATAAAVSAKLTNGK
jgi:hypothetical protein